MKIKDFFLSFLLFFTSVTSSLLSTEESPITGTLIVTYQTGQKSERLDRIRFWVKNGKHKQSLYPKGKAFVDDLVEFTRMVVIEDLTPGQYTLDFLIPNTDRYFEEVPIRKVTIAKGGVVKIDQVIKSREAFLEMEEMAEEEREELTAYLEEKTEPSFTKEEVVEETEDSMKCGKLIVSFDIKENPGRSEHIFFRLVDEEGHVTVHPEVGVDTEIPLEAGKMVMIRQIPAGDYTLEFFVEFEKEEYSLSILQVQIDENKTRSIHQSL